MPQQVTITQVAGPGEPWSNDFGTFHPYTLTVNETNQPITVNRRPDSPPLELGLQVWVETKPGRNGALSGKIVKAPDGAPPPQQLPSSSPAQPVAKPSGAFHAGTQSAIKSAVAYAAAFDNPPSADIVIEVAKQFFAAMQEMEQS